MKNNKLIWYVLIGILCIVAFSSFTTKNDEDTNDDPITPGGDSITIGDETKEYAPDGTLLVTHDASKNTVTYTEEGRASGLIDREEVIQKYNRPADTSTATRVIETPIETNKNGSMTDEKQPIEIVSYTTDPVTGRTVKTIKTLDPKALDTLDFSNNMDNLIF